MCGPETRGLQSHKRGIVTARQENANQTGIRGRINLSLYIRHNLEARIGASLPENTTSQLVGHREHLVSGSLSRSWLPVISYKPRAISCRALVYCFYECMFDTFKSRYGPFQVPVTMVHHTRSQVEYLVSVECARRLS